MPDDERIHDWFEMHLDRHPYDGRACINYKYEPPLPARTLELDNSVSRGCRGDTSKSGEHPIVEVRHLCNERPDGTWDGLPHPWIIGDPGGLDIIAATVIVRGLDAHAKVRYEDGTCSDKVWTTTLVHRSGRCPCPPTSAGLPCKTPPCL